MYNFEVSYGGGEPINNVITKKKTVNISEDDFEDFLKNIFQKYFFFNFLKNIFSSIFWRIFYEEYIFEDLFEEFWRWTEDITGDEVYTERTLWVTSSRYRY